MNFYEIRTSKLHRWRVYFGPFERHCLRADNKIPFTRWDRNSLRIESGYQHLLALRILELLEFKMYGQWTAFYMLS